MIENNNYHLTSTIFEQILAVRDTGYTNMLDAKMVQAIANNFGYYDLVVFIEEYPKEYIDIIFHGTPDGFIYDEDEA